MEPIRSLLFVPADNEDWVRSAPEKYPADGFVFDLEDSVEPSNEHKQAARETLLDASETFRETDAVVTVRVNGPQTEYFDADLDAVARAGIDAIVIPDLTTPEEVRRTDHVLTHLERVRGLENSIGVIGSPETAYGLNNVYDLCAASDRVVAITGSSGENADPQRALGYEFTREGRERQYLLSKVVMEGRAAGLDQIIAGVWMAIDDLDGLGDEARQLRQFGYTGMMVIHPSHVEPVNEVFTPDEETISHARRLIDAYERAEGSGAIRFEGDMIDIAHVKTARQTLERARAFDLVE